MPENMNRCKSNVVTKYSSAFTEIPAHGGYLVLIFLTTYSSLIMEQSNLWGYIVQNWWYIMNVFIMIYLAHLSHENFRLHKQDGNEATYKEIY